MELNPECVSVAGTLTTALLVVVRHALKLHDEIQDRADRSAARERELYDSLTKQNEIDRGN